MSSASAPATARPPQAEAVQAAGALVWKMVDGKVRVLLVHRTQHKDVSLPKGKVDPGETLPHTAVREIAEETGFAVVLGAPLGTVEYRLPNGRDKVVHYWSAEVDAGHAERHSYEANGEIRALEWVPLAKAAKHLTYEHDAEIVERFAAQLDAGSPAPSRSSCCGTARRCRTSGGTAPTTPARCCTSGWSSRSRWPAALPRTARPFSSRARPLAASRRSLRRRPRRRWP